MAATVKRRFSCAIALGLVASAAAQAGDPTRPPAQMLEQPRNDAAGQPRAQPNRADIKLQAILRMPGRTPGAMIDGWVLRVGDTLQGMRLVGVGDSHADLLVDGERLRVSLTPAVRRAERSEDQAQSQAPAAQPQKAPARAKRGKERT
jgi:hypothetical protein